MKIKLVSQNDWIFTDSHIEDYREWKEIHTARNTRFGFQVLIEEIKGTVVLELSEISGVNWEIGQMRAVRVDENTAPKLMTTTNYEECKEYVTREAPFSVYDCITASYEEAAEEKAVFYIRGRVEKSAIPARYEVELRVRDAATSETQRLSLEIYPIDIPAPKEGKIGMLNFFAFDLTAKEHGVKKGSKEYAEIYKKYLKLQLDFGQTHIMLPLPEVIRNEEKEVVDFDFDFVEQIADIAIAAGAKYLVGACVSHWDAWNESGYYLLWDKTVDACGTEGFLQLKKYYRKWAEIVEKKGYRPYLYHSLADEPQIPNAASYRSLAAIFRRFMPEIPLIEAVEAIELGGALDIWVPKGETFERWETEYRKLMESGEEFWYYTCAFPAGAYMNRSMDLPAVVSRYILWMVPYYEMSGYLHWGFNYYSGENIWEKACCPHKGELLPAGDAHIVYAIGDEVYPSLRFELQREGRDEAEAFYMLKDEAARKALIAKAVSGQNKYQADSRLTDEIKKELLREIRKQNQEERVRGDFSE